MPEIQIPIKPYSKTTLKVVYRPPTFDEITNAMFDIPAPEEVPPEEELLIIMNVLVRLAKQCVLNIDTSPLKKKNIKDWKEYIEEINIVSESPNLEEDAIKMKKILKRKKVVQ